MEQDGPTDPNQGNGNLAQALTRMLGTRGWDGVPTPKAIALALSKILQLEALEGQTPQSRKARGLINALIDALSNRTIDGWKLDLKGTKGPKVGFEKRAFDFELGEFITDQIENGELYEAAVAAAMARFHCGRTKATGAHQAYIRFCSMLDQGEEQALDDVRDELSRHRASPE